MTSHFQNIKKIQMIHCLRQSSGSIHHQETPYQQQNRPFDLQSRKLNKLILRQNSIVYMDQEAYPSFKAGMYKAPFLGERVLVKIKSERESTARNFSNASTERNGVYTQKEFKIQLNKCKGLPFPLSHASIIKQRDPLIKNEISHRRVVSEQGRMYGPANQKTIETPELVRSFISLAPQIPTTKRFEHRFQNDDVSQQAGFDRTNYQESLKHFRSQSINLTSQTGQVLRTTSSLYDSPLVQTSWATNFYQQKHSSRNLSATKPQSSHFTTNLSTQQTDCLAHTQYSQSIIHQDEGHDERRNPSNFTTFTDDQSIKSDQYQSGRRLKNQSAQLRQSAKRQKVRFQTPSKDQRHTKYCQLTQEIDKQEQTYQERNQRITAVLAKLPKLKIIISQ
ncbi:hypothetical protein FGO68_gene7238 [Halteria grandinella]|uniref:Uncharacterized protein n=1 Tax=Halteria grandinella TaxID=5974 RepID=A0A8J8SW97_HALGN|nr:hypothetical protein FGO68_gene7238 [Halteria grandinella]